MHEQPILGRLDCREAGCSWADGTQPWEVFARDTSPDARPDDKVILAENMPEANARRLCAAWNAVEGLSTAALESGAVKDLLAACRAFVTACDSAPPLQVMKHISAACEIGRAALAKCQLSSNP
jgi:hypothetical protein